MKPRFLAAGLLMLAVSLLIPPNMAGALGLRVTPVDYPAKLAPGETKKGVIDIANPDEKQPMHVSVSVKAFRQINDQGALEFYNDEQITAGVTPDLKSFDLGPREAMRMYFLIDGKKLASGDSFAAVLFNTEGKASPNGASSGSDAQVGTLLYIENGTPGERKAEIASIDIPFFQMHGKAEGKYVIKNSGESEKASGYIPEVTLEVSPFGGKANLPSALVFAGRSREVGFSVPDGRFGLYNVSVRTGDSAQSKWVLFASPDRLILLALAILLLVIVVRAFRRRGKRGYFSARQKK